MCCKDVLLALHTTNKNKSSMETKLRKILTDNGMIETEKHNKAIHEICIIIQRFNELNISKLCPYIN